MKDEAQKYINIIDDMLLDDVFEFAEETLQGIRKWIAENKTVTQNQITAVDNILNSKPHSQTYFDWRM